MPSNNTAAARHQRADESRPLLGDSSQDGSQRGYQTNGIGESSQVQNGRANGSHAAVEPDEEDNVEEEEVPKETTPLPKMQLFILCVMRLSEPISFTVIFPFVNEQLHEVLPHVPKSQIGYYAGVAESMFAVVQVCTVFLWGRLSDSIGRKPVLLTGMLGTFVSINAFGLARSFPAMIAARCISGLFNANVSVLKSMLGEITDSTNSARAFSMLPMMYAVGTIVGPWLGGTLSHPAETFPDLFGNIEFFKKYPFYLPCGMASLYILFAWIVGFFFLNETLASKVRRNEAKKLRRDAQERAEEQQQQRQQGHQRTSSTDVDPAQGEGQAQQIEDEEEAKASSPPPVRSLLTTQVVRILSTQMLLNLQNISFTSLLPLFCFALLPDFGRADIGHLLATNGVLAILTQSIVFPLVVKRLGGPVATYRFALMLQFPAFLVFPLAKLASDHFGYHATWVTFVFGMTFKALSGMSIVCATILVVNAAPSRSSLGALNGLSQTFGSLSRAIGPTMATSLFAFSNTHRGFGNLVWVVMLSFSTAAWLLSMRISPRVNKPLYEK